MSNKKLIFTFLFVTLFLILVLAVFSYVGKKADSSKESGSNTTNLSISLSEAHRSNQSGVPMLGVPETGERNGGDVVNAVHLSRGGLTDNAVNVIIDPETQTFTY